MSFLDNLHYRSLGIRCSRNYDTQLRDLATEINSVPLDYDLIDQPTACAFSPLPNHCHILASVTERKGNLMVQNTRFRGRKLRQATVTPAHDNTIFTVEWVNEELKVVTGSGDHTCKLWQLDNSGAGKHLATFEGHSGSIRKIAFQPGSSNNFATGARDGIVNLWDCRDPSSQTLTIAPDKQILHGLSFGRHPNVYGYAKKTKLAAHGLVGLVYKDENYLLSSTTFSSEINVWDIRKTYSVSRNPFPMNVALPRSSKAVTDMIVNQSRTLLFINSRENQIEVYDLKDLDVKGKRLVPVFSYGGYVNETFYNRCHLSPDEKYLSTMTQGNIMIWRVGNSNPICELHLPQTYEPHTLGNGHPCIDGAFSDFDWCRDEQIKIAACGDGPVPVIFDIYTGHYPREESYDRILYSRMMTADVLPPLTTTKKILCQTDPEHSTINLLKANLRKDKPPLTLNLPNSVTDEPVEKTIPIAKTPKRHWLFLTPHNSKIGDTSSSSLMAESPSSSSAVKSSSQSGKKSRKRKLSPKPESPVARNSLLKYFKGKEPGERDKHALLDCSSL